jgi:hypothetical protein
VDGVVVAIRRKIIQIEQQLLSFCHSRTKHSSFLNLSRIELAALLTQPLTTIFFGRSCERERRPQKSLLARREQLRKGKEEI